MTPLNPKDGGKSRDIDRPAWEAKFMGALAGASRPLKEDHPSASDPKAAAKLLKEEAKKFPWQILSVVGRDGRSAGSTLSEAEIVSRINKMGGLLGFAGIVWLRGRFCIFVRPLTEGGKVLGQLTAAMEKLIPPALEILKQSMREIEEGNR